MRNVFICAIMVLLTLSCAKKESANPTDGTSYFKQGFIPHWGNDTLDHNGFDEIITFKNNDTTKILHQNTVYYIWWCTGGSSIEETTTFNDSTQVWVYCWIGKKCFDTTSATSMCSVSNKIYWNKSFPVPQWDTQGVFISISTHLDSFHVNGGNGYW